MSDPRNVAHDKKVIQEKKHEGAVEADEAAAIKPGKKPRAKKAKAEPAPAAPEAGAEGEESAPAATSAPAPAANLEESRKVLAKLKDMEHHSRANIEHLAGLLLTVEDELKQKEFSAQLNEVYSAQDNFQTKVAALIEAYKTMVDNSPGA